ncbi:retrotransposable element protein, partial [Planoprotostelium fungivorum]
LPHRKQPAVVTLLYHSTGSKDLTVIIDGEQEYEVETILDVRKRYGKTQYLVSWKGYGPEENLWLPEDNLSNSPDLVADFKARTACVTTSKRKCKN